MKRVRPPKGNKQWKGEDARRGLSASYLMAEQRRRDVAEIMEIVVSTKKSMSDSNEPDALYSKACEDILSRLNSLKSTSKEEESR